MDFFSRLSRSEPGAEPTNLAQVQADDALIESLRAVPLFSDPGLAGTAFDPANTLKFNLPGVRADGLDPDGLDADGPGADRRDPSSLGTDDVAAGDLDAGDTDDERIVGRHSAEAQAARHADAQLALLLQAWRREIDSVPMPPPIDVEIATAVVQSAPPRRRAVRPMIAVAAAIAGLLVGSAAIGARSATPDTLLWPLTQLLWGDRADSVEAGIVAREGIESASAALEAGHPVAAEVALDGVAVVITKVDGRDGRQDLESDYQDMKEAIESVSSSSSAVVTPSSPVSTPLTAPVNGLPTSPEPVFTPTESENPDPAPTPDEVTPEPTPTDPVETPGEPTEATEPTETPVDTPTEATPTDVTTTSADEGTVSETTGGGEAIGGDSPAVQTQVTTTAQVPGDPAEGPAA